MARSGAARRAERDAETTRLFDAASLTHGTEAHRELLVAVVLLNLHVAHSTAWRFEGRGIPVEDLEQVASLALVRAAHKFDPERGRDFLTYAVPFMTGELKHHFRDRGWMVRPPRSVQSIQSRVVDAYRSGVDSGRPPSSIQLAEQLGLSEPDVREALTARGCFWPLSLDEPVNPGSDEVTLGASLEDRDRDDLGVLETRLVLASAMETLSREDRKLLYLRFVIEKSQAAIARELGVGQRDVSRQLERILHELQTELGAIRTEVA